LNEKKNTNLLPTSENTETTLETRNQHERGKEKRWLPAMENPTAGSTNMKIQTHWLHGEAVNYPIFFLAEDLQNSNREDMKYCSYMILKHCLFTEVNREALYLPRKIPIPASYTQFTVYSTEK
jgi:hypothetical protein